jgi:hypothetical protein
MMLYQSGRGIDPGEICVRLNPGSDDGEFAVIDLTGGAALFIQSAAEADVLIAAAVEAKRLLLDAEVVDATITDDDADEDGPMDDEAELRRADAIRDEATSSVTR